jgi:replicative DNA helicase
VGEYIKILRDKTLLRELAEASQKILEDIYSGEGAPREVVENAERMVYDIRQGREIKGLYQHQKRAFRCLRPARRAGAATRGSCPRATGVAELDNFIAGLNKSDLILMASRPGIGKRRPFALNIGLHAAKQTGQGGGRVSSLKCPGAAGHAASLQRGAGGFPQAAHRRAVGGRLGQGRPGQQYAV